jgi:hypothetical protein
VGVGSAMGTERRRDQPVEMGKIPWPFDLILGECDQKGVPFRNIKSWASIWNRANRNRVRRGEFSVVHLRSEGQHRV